MNIHQYFTNFYYYSTNYITIIINFFKANYKKDSTYNKLIEFTIRC